MNAMEERKEGRRKKRGKKRLIEKQKRRVDPEEVAEVN